MLKDFPLSYEEATDWGWAECEPYAQELLTREISISLGHTGCRQRCMIEEPEERAAAGRILVPCKRL